MTASVWGLLNHDKFLNRLFSPSQEHEVCVGLSAMLFTLFPYPISYLTLSQTSPGFFVSTVQVFGKHCVKRRNCS